MSNTPTHYILLRESLATWARRCGAMSSNWQQEVFDDFVDSAGQVTYTTDPDSNPSSPSIQLLGRRFRGGARCDHRRTDTLFVIGLQTRPPTSLQQKPLRRIIAHWQLTRDDGSILPTVDPLTEIPELLGRAEQVKPPLDTPGPELIEALTPILHSWSDAQFLARIPPPTPLVPALLLASMRQKYIADLRIVSHLITNDNRERTILQGRISPGDARTLSDVHARFSFSFLEQIRVKQPSQLEPALATILDLPPPVVTVVHLIQIWLAAVPHEERLRRQSAIEGWLARGDRSYFPSDLWEETVGRTWLREVVPITIGVPSPPLAPTPMKSSSDDPMDPADEIEPTPIAANVDLASPPVIEESQSTVLDQAATTANELCARSPIPSELTNALVPTTEQHADFLAHMRLRLLALRSAHMRGSQVALDVVAKEVGRCAAELSTAAGDLCDPAAVAHAREALVRVGECYAKAIALLPSVEELAGITADVDHAIGRWQMRPKLATARDWINRVNRWSDVEDILSIVSDKFVEELPLWFFRELVPAVAEPAEMILGAMTDQGGREAVQVALTWLHELLDQHGEDALLWVWEAQPGAGASAVDRLRAGVLAKRDAETLRPKFVKLVERLAPWAETLWDTGELAPADLVHSLQVLSDGLDELGRVAPRLFDGMLSHLRIADGLLDAHTRLREMEETFRKVPKDKLTEVPNLSFLTWLAGELGVPVARKIKPTDEASPIEVHHCVSERGAVRAAQLVARPDPIEPVLHLVDVPINLRSNTPRNLRLVLEIDAPHLAGRPVQWRERLRRRDVVASEDDWFSVEGSYLATVVLRDIPVVPTKTDGTASQRLTLSFSGRDELTNLLVKRTELNFETLLFDLPSFDLAFGDTTSPEEMRTHPLGIQAHFKEIRETVLAGRSSFLIAAPRRFGKTTFLQALVEEIRGNDVVAIGPVTASTHTDVSAAFVEICNRLGKELDAHVATNWTPQLLPDGDTFDAARRRAFELSKRAIYFLFDESQALFAGRRGKEAAELLKARIEKEWGRAREGLVPIRFGLVGQLHLRRLIAGQLDGVFANNRAETEIRPDHIERLLRETTHGRMQSTSHARKLLASVSRNLLVLRFLLRALRTQLIEEHRSWFHHTDVQRAFEEQIQEATRGSSTLGRYVLDPLNSDDNLTNWRPIRAFPVALAWAAVQVEGIKGHPARIEHVRQNLATWSSDFTQRGTVSADRIEECLRDLQDVMVLDETNSFCSQLLERYLARLAQSSSPLREPQEWQALQSLVVDSVSLPERMEPIGRGGQANVFRADLDTRVVTVRVVEIEGDEARRSFIETCYALKAIEGTRSRAPGYQALPVVRQVGYTRDDLSQGAVIYDWIPGADLSNRLGQLDEAAVLELGRPLAEALAVLEQRGVVHRDLRPENIVVDPSGVPVLIDFGLARLLERSPKTRPQPTEFLAPETMSTTPRWTSRADVYALGVTLRKMLRHLDAASPLGRILAVAAHDDMQKRLSPELLIHELSGLAAQLSIDRARQKKYDSAVAQCRQLSTEWARGIAERHVPSMVATALGMFDHLEALRLAAQLLDDLFEEYCRRPMGNALSLQHLTQLKEQAPKNLPAPLKALYHKESFATGYLRHGNAHRRTQDENLKRALGELGHPRDTTKQLENAVLETAQRMERGLSLGELHKLIQDWVQASRAAKIGAHSV